MRISATAAVLAVLLFGALSLVGTRASAQGGAGSSPVTGSGGICNSGGCVPKSQCGTGTLCSPFPEHPAYDPNVEFQKGLAAYKAGDYAKAKWEFDRVLYLAPTNADALFAEGMAEVGLGDLAGAAQAYSQALKWSPKQINAARELAITEAKLGKDDQAAAQLAALKAWAARCGAGCREANELNSAIDAVQAVLPPPRS